MSYKLALKIGAGYWQTVINFRNIGDMMKIKLLLKFFILCLIISGNFNNVIAEHYSIQVKSFPRDEKASALKFYNELKDAGYFVYMHTSRIENDWWIRVKIGYFVSKEKADQFGKKINANSGLNYWINTEHVSIDSSDTNYVILTTPSGIWIERNSNFEEVYSFLPHIYHESILLETKAIVSAVSDEIVFYVHQKLIKVNLKTKDAVILKEAQEIEGLNKSSPKWSYDGKYIAYMDSYTWEISTKLWVMQNDGTHDKCIIQDITNQKKVKDFSWHPSKEEIFYIFGSTYGAMDLGGDLYSVNIETLKSRMIATTENRHKFLIEKIKTGKDGIILTIMQLQDAAPLKKRKYIEIPLPEDSTLIKLKEEDFR